MIRRSWFRSASLSFQEVILGWALGVTINFGESSVCVLNVHNFGLDTGSLARLRIAITRCLSDAHDTIGVVAGDFNIPLARDARSGQLVPAPCDAASRAIQGMLARGVEIVHPAATRFSAARAKVSHLDRFGGASPYPLMLCQVVL